MQDDDEPLDFTITRRFVTDAEEIADGTFWLPDRSLDDSATDQRRDTASRARSVIENPTCVFSGLQRENFWHECFCYCRPVQEIMGVPQFNGRVGYVLLYFVFLERDRLFILDWEPRKEAPDRPGFPIGYNGDFGTLEWERRKK